MHEYLISARYNDDKEVLLLKVKTAHINRLVYIINENKIINYK